MNGSAKYRRSKGLHAALAIVGASSVLLVAGCSSSGTSSSESTASAASSETSSSASSPEATVSGAPTAAATPRSGGDKFIIGIAAAKVANPAANLTYAGIKQQAEALGMEVKILDSNLDINKQVSDIDQLTAAGADAIFVHLVGDPNAVRGPLQRAAEAGVRINGIDALPTVEGVDVIADQDSVIMAATAADYVGKQLGGTGQVACVGSIPIPVLEIRVATCEETFKDKYPGIEVVARVDALPDDASGGRTVAEQLLVKYPDLKAILSVTDVIGAGTAAAVKSAGKDVITTGLGASPESINAIKAGSMTYVLDPRSQEIGADAVQQVYDILTGKLAPPTETLVVDSVPDPYTKENVDSWIDPTTIVGVVN